METFVVIVFFLIIGIIAIAVIAVKIILFALIGLAGAALFGAFNTAGAAGAGALAVGATALLVYALWDTLRDKIAEWLRKNHLNQSALMEVVLCFDRVVSASKTQTRKILQTLKVVRTTGQHDKIEEEEFDIDEMPVEIQEKARKALQNGHSSMVITSQVLTC